VIGGSAGGYAAIREVMKDLAEDIPAAIILLLHRWSAHVIDFSISLKSPHRTDSQDRRIHQLIVHSQTI